MQRPLHFSSCNLRGKLLERNEMGEGWFTRWDYHVMTVIYWSSRVRSACSRVVMAIVMRFLYVY